MGAHRSMQQRLTKNVFFSSVLHAQKQNGGVTMVPSCIEIKILNYSESSGPGKRRSFVGLPCGAAKLKSSLTNHQQRNSISMLHAFSGNMI